MDIGGHPRIIVSRDDMSNGMLQQPVWGVYGYRADSAQKLLTNIVLQAKAAKGG